MPSGIAHVSELIPRLREAIEAGDLTIPVMPETAIRVREAAEDPNTTGRDIARILEADPALAARVLRLANSALYAGRTEIKDLTHAIVRLGSSTVVSLVVGAAGQEVFRSNAPEAAAILHDAWTRSIYAAAIASLLSDRFYIPREEGLIAGLLHAAGEPIVLQLIEDLVERGAIPRPDPADLRDILAELSPEAGVRLLEAWDIPAQVVAAIAHYQDPASADEVHRHRAAMVALAAAGGVGFLEGKQPHELVGELLDHPANELLVLDQLTIGALLEKALEHGREMARAFAS